MKRLGEWKAARYIFSAAGIILGLAAAMVVFGLYEGGRSILREQYWSNGVKVYDITGEDLGRADGKLLEEKMPEAKGNIPVLKLDAKLKSYKASSNTTTLAVNEKYKGYANLQILKGRFINVQDVEHANKVVLLDNITAAELYGTTDIIGQKLDLQVGGRKIEFEIAGVFKNFNRNIETLFDDEYAGLCLIPDSVPEDVAFEYNMDKLVVMVDSSLHKDAVAVRLKHLLQKEHEAEDVYKVEEYGQLAEVKAFTDKYMVFAVIIAIVGLITGGIGTMNAMLLSIEERKKEIGLYKFYGSGVRELQQDIVFRTFAICLGFGLLGLFTGLLAGSLIGSFLNISTGLSILSVLITAAASAFIGIIFSIYPAARVRQVDVSSAIWGE